VWTWPPDSGGPPIYCFFGRWEPVKGMLAKPLQGIIAGLADTAAMDVAVCIL